MLPQLHKRQQDKIQCFLELFIHSSGHNFTPEYNKFTTNSHTPIHTHTHNKSKTVKLLQFEDTRKEAPYDVSLFSFTLNTVMF